MALMWSAAGRRLALALPGFAVASLSAATMASSAPAAASTGGVGSSSFAPALADRPAGQPAFVPAGNGEGALPRRPVPGDPLALANWWRGFAGRYPDAAPLPPLTTSPAYTESTQRQLDYLAWLRSKGSPYCGHGTDPAFPPPPSLGVGLITSCSVGWPSHRPSTVG